jgi:hypothetical protein
LLCWLPETEHPKIDTFVRAGWKRGFSEMRELRDIGLAVAGESGILLRPFGEFDDQEVGVDLLVAPTLLSTLVALNEGSL